MGIFISGVVGGYSLIRSAKSRAIINETGKLETALYAYYASTGNLPASNLSDRIYYNFSCDVFKSLYDENIDQTHIRKVENCDSNSSTINNEQQFHSKDHSLIYTIGYNEPRKKNVVFLLSNDSSAEPESIETLQNITYLDENRRTQDTQNIKLNTASVTIKLAKEIDTKMDDGVYNTGKVQSFSASNRPDDETCEYYKDNGGDNNKGDILNNNNALFYKLHKDSVNCVPSFSIAVGSEYSKKEEEKENIEEGEFCTISPIRIDNSSWKLSNGNSISSKVKVGQTITAYCNNGYYNSQSASNEDNTNDNIPIMNATCSEGGNWNYGTQTGECYKYCEVSVANSLHKIERADDWIQYNKSTSNFLKENQKLVTGCKGGLEGSYRDYPNNQTRNGEIFLRKNQGIGGSGYSFTLLCKNDGTFERTDSYLEMICYKACLTPSEFYDAVEFKSTTNNFIISKETIINIHGDCPDFTGTLTCDGTTGNWVSNGGNFSCHAGYKDCISKANMSISNYSDGFGGAILAGNSNNIKQILVAHLEPFNLHVTHSTSTSTGGSCPTCDDIITGIKPRATRLCNKTCDKTIYCCNGEYYANPCNE